LDPDPAPETLPVDPAASGNIDPAAQAGLPAEAVTGHAAPDLSPLSLFLQADPVVQGVMILLVLASVACWAILIDKLFRIGALRRQAIRLERHAARGDAAARPVGKLGPMASSMLDVGLAEWREHDPRESRAEWRTRIEQSMREAAADHLRQAEPGLPMLATIGSISPFVGLLGTVWGIMHSFAGIAASNDTSLAVVAPGIAEALFATAIGLIAAIPAVMAYNKLTTDLGRLGQRLDRTIAKIGGELTRERHNAAMLQAAE
jgi:TolQ protein